MKVKLFSASWCSPCQSFKPVFQKVSADFPNHEFEVIDVTNNAEPLISLGVRSIPTMAVYGPDDTLKTTRSGTLSDPELRAFFTEAINA